MAFKIGEFLFTACLVMIGTTSCMAVQEESVDQTEPQEGPTAEAQQALGACGMWQADPDPWFPGNTSSYSNGANEGTGNSCAGWGTYGYLYQCVELAQRYYAIRFGHPNVWSRVAAAKDMCTNQ